MLIVDVESCQKSQLYNYANANMMVKFCFGYFSQVLVAWNLSLVKLLNCEPFGGLQKQFASKGFTLSADATLYPETLEPGEQNNQSP